MHLKGSPWPWQRRGDTLHEIIEENAYERCVCCNRIQNNLTNLSVCNFAYLIERLVDVKLKTNISKVCGVCHSILKRIYKFTKQLEASFGLEIMQNTSNTNWCNLEKSNVVTLDTQLPVNQHNELTEVNITAEDIPKITNEVSDQNESSHSEENYEDLQIEPSEPLRDKKLQDTSKCHKTVLPVTKKPRTQLEANYKGKIKIITISVDEVMKERKEELLSKKYLRLPYKCEGCIVSFHYEHGLQQHLNKSHFPHKNGIKCSLCSCIFPTQLSYDGHSRRHLKRYECIPCGKRSMAVYPLLKHYNEVHDIIKESYKCKRCNFVTTKYSEHRRHRRTHGRKAFCNLCDKTFANNTSLAVHVSSVHNTSNETFPCDECDKVYNKRASLLAHQRSHKPGFFYCDDCQRTFKSKAILSTHLKRHLRHAKDDAWRYKCNDCDEKFMVKRNLEDHINFEHLKIIKYVCDVCSKVQPNSSRHSLQTMMADLQNECPKIPEDEIPTNPTSGELYTGYYEKDSSWYRVLIASSVISDRVSVYFCDYGDLAMCPIRALRPVPAIVPLARTLPPQAIKARLYDVWPLHQDWSVEDCIRFQELCVEQQFVGICKEVGKDPLNPSEPLLTLDLIDTSTDEDVYLNKQLVAEERARLGSASTSEV